MNQFINLRTWVATGVATVMLSGVIVSSHAAEDPASAIDKMGNELLPQRVPMDADLLNAAAMEKKEHNLLPWEKGSVTFGGFIAAFKTDIGIGVNSAGVTINAEELLGLETSLFVWRAQAMYRPGKSLRNQVDFSYTAYNRSGSGTLSEEIVIGGNTYPVGSQMETIFNFDIIRTTYSYAIVQDERTRIALGLGLYVIPLKYSISVVTTGGKDVAEGETITLPLPSFALRGECQVVRKLFLNASIDAMYLQFGDFQGSLMDVYLGLEYRPWRHVGLGVGYNALAVHVQGDTTDSNYPGANFTGAVDVAFSGLLMYAKWSF